MNEEKTRVFKVPEGEFDFRGYTFGRMYSARTGQARIGYRPSKKSIRRAVARKIHALTERSCTWQETTKLVGKVSRTLHRWANYLAVGTVSERSRRCGCAGGCASSTKSGGEGAGAIHSCTSTATSGSYV